ncbi:MULTISPECIES: hypothetical protein [Nostocaceae]|nr:MULTISPECIES: hypothetical protein [Nostocaceae]
MMLWRGIGRISSLEKQCLLSFGKGDRNSFTLTRYFAYTPKF